MTIDKEALVQVLKSFDQANDALWTDDGSPLMSEVQRLANDKTVTRAQVNDAIPGFARKSKAFVEEPPDEDETDLVAVENTDVGADLDSDDDDVFSPAEERDQVKAIAQKRVLDAELALVAAQSRTVEARRAEYEAEKRLTVRKQQLAAKFPPISAAENLQQHLKRQQEILMERVMGVGFVPAVAANPVDQRLMDRKRNNGLNARGSRGPVPGPILPRKASAYTA
jgi:hypothetical protein